MAVNIQSVDKWINDHSKLNADNLNMMGAAIVANANSIERLKGSSSDQWENIQSLLALHNKLLMTAQSLIEQTNGVSDEIDGLRNEVIGTANDAQTALTLYGLRKADQQIIGSDSDSEYDNTINGLRKAITALYNAIQSVQAGIDTEAQTRTDDDARLESMISMEIDSVKGSSSDKWDQYSPTLHGINNKVDGMQNDFSNDLQTLNSSIISMNAILSNLVIDAGGAAEADPQSFT